ncbi:hypothetical protein ACWGDT_24410 [Streptomyces avermitilis]
MTRNLYTHDDTQPKHRGLRLAAVVASAIVAGGIIIPASAAVAAPTPTSPVVNLVDPHGDTFGAGHIQDTGYKHP